jgi:hypothetical protein
MEALGATLSDLTSQYPPQEAHTRETPAELEPQCFIKSLDDPLRYSHIGAGRKQGRRISITVLTATEVFTRMWCPLSDTRRIYCDPARSKTTRKCGRHYRTGNQSGEVTNSNGK